MEEPLYHPVDLRDHCAFCLRRFDPGGGSEIIKDLLGTRGRGRAMEGEEMGDLPSSMEEDPIGGGGITEEDEEGQDHLAKVMEMEGVTRAVVRVPWRSFNHIWGYLLKGGEGGTAEVKYKFGDGKDGVCDEIPPMCHSCRDKIQELEELHQELMRKVEDIKRVVVESRRKGGAYFGGSVKLEKTFQNAGMAPFVKESTFQFLDHLLKSSRFAVVNEDVESSMNSAQDSVVGVDDDYVKEEVDFPSSKDSDAEEGFDFEGGDADVAGESRACFIDEGMLSGDQLHWNPMIPVSKKRKLSAEARHNENDLVKVNVEKKTTTRKKMARNWWQESIAAEPELVTQFASGLLTMQTKSSKSKCITIEEEFRVEQDQTVLHIQDSDPVVKEEIDSSHSSNGEEEQVLGFETDKEEPEEINTTDVEYESSAEEKVTKRKLSRRIKSPKKVTKKTNIKGQLCDLCHQRIPFPEIRQHLESHNVGEYICKCPNPTCPFVFSNRRSLEAHHLWDRDNRYVKCRNSLDIVDRKLNSYWFITCEDCGHKSEDYTSLSVHIRKAHENKASWKYACPINDCFKRFSVKQSVEYHLRRHDLGGRQIQCCPLCSAGTSRRHKTREEIAKHLKKVHKVKEVIECKQCPFLFPNRDSLLDHVKQHRHEGILCDICDDDQVKYSSYASFKEHYFSAHKIGLEFICQDCSRAFDEKSKLQAHIKVAHLVKPDEPVIKLPIVRVKCDSCPESSKTFKSEELLYAHKIQVHGAEPFKCQFCTTTVLTKKALDYHENLHGGSKEFKCEFENCDKVFSTRRMYMKHTLRHRKKQMCETCGKEFYGKHNLQQHINSIHLGLKKFVCEVCGTHLATLYSLICHRRIHTGERPYSCSFCSEAFRDSPHLRQHLRVHHRPDSHLPVGESSSSGGLKRRRARRKPRPSNDPNSKSVVCETCGKGFVSNGNLRLHQKTVHSNAPKPSFPCDICGDKLSSEMSLDQHKRIHNGERPFQCHLCPSNQAFRTIGALNAHLKRHERKGEKFRPRGPVENFKRKKRTQEPSN